MNTELQSLNLCLFGCWFFTIQSNAGEVLPPRNVSELWDGDFNPGLSWCPPPHPGDNCSYDVSATVKSSTVTRELNASSLNFSLLIMEGGSVHWSVTTVCRGAESEPAVLNVSYPELAKDLDCFLYSPHGARCQWSPVRRPPDVGFYYKLVNECDEDAAPLALQECSSPDSAGGVRSGCELRATRCHVVYVLFNGTVDGRPVRNTFRRRLKDAVRPPLLDWTVTKRGNKFNISWNPPEIAVPDGWTIQINYTECGATHEPLDVEGRTSHQLVLHSRCGGGMAVRAKSRSGATPWGDWRHFDADELPNVVLYAAPVLIAALVAMICACFQKNKATIFPKVPEPIDYLSEFSNNNTKSMFHNVYTPVKEEECKISVVLDPQLSGTNC